MELYRLVSTDEERRGLEAQLLFVIRDKQAEADARLGAEVRAILERQGGVALVIAREGEDARPEVRKERETQDL